MKKLLAIILTAAMVVTLVPTTFAFAESETADEEVLPSSSSGVHLTVAADNSGRMPTGLGLTDASYDKYFGGNEGDAAVAVAEILSAGKLSINGMAFPATYAEYTEKGYQVNGSDVSVSATGEDDYVSAAIAAATKAVPIGNTITLSDSDNDGVCDAIAYDCYASFIVNKITDNQDGTYTLERAAVDGGKPYDQQLFAAGNTEKVYLLDDGIEVGDMALARYMTDGWYIIRAYEANGILVDGADHAYYQIDDVQYGDAMRFSRDNIVISNRCGEFTNAQKYFGFMNNDEGLKVSLWLVPVAEDCETTGAPCGFTSNENSATFLKRAIETALAKLESVQVSEDGYDVAVGSYWVTQDAYVELAEAITDAQAVLDAGAAGELMDYQVYLLYLKLHGSSDDIGAKFAGYDYVGFDNEMQEGYVLAQWSGDFNPLADSNNGIYISEVTGQYFEGDGSEQAVVDAIDELLDAGKVTVNGTVIPTEEPEIVLDENERSVAVDLNGYRGLWYQKDLDTIDIDGDQVIDTVSKWTWQGHDKLMSDKGYKSTKGSPYMLQVPLLGDETEEEYREGGFEFARRHFVLALSMLRGNTVTLYAGETEDGGRTTTAAAISFDVWSACQVEKMIDNGDGTTTIYGVPVDATSYNTDGGPNDVEPRTFKTANIASNVDIGDTCFYQCYDGEWYLKSCKAIEGYIESSGSNYDIGLIVDGEKTVYCDALVTRFNMQAGSRPSQVLGEINNLDLSSVPVTLWVTDGDYVVGISHMQYAGDALALAIEHVEEYVADVVVSEDGSDVSVAKRWVTQEAWDTFEAVLENGKLILKTNGYTNAQIDAATYALSSAYSTLVKAAAQGTKPLDTVHLTVAADNSGRMPTGLALTDASYDKYFGGNEGDAAKVVPEILAAGNLYINFNAFPATYAEYQESGYQVNGSDVTVSATGEEDYIAAAVAAATKAVPIGNTITLVDQDDDGVYDAIYYDCYAAFIVNKITDNEDGTYTLERAAVEGGKPYDQQLFAAGNTDKVYLLDDGIEVGDMALARLIGEEWCIIRAYEANGILVDGADHAYYQIDDVQYEDAMRFSRDNIVISNRCGEFTNAQKYFGFMNNDEGLEVSLWLVPVEDDCETTGAPCGFTSNENAAEFLERAIAIAQAKLDSVSVSYDGSGIDVNGCWVTKAAYNELAEAIAEAQAVLDAGSASELMDYQVYLLYLKLHGSADDIGAKFAGYDYVGFDNEINIVDGLANAPEEDGNWYYYVDGEVDKDFTSLAQNKYGWWYVENGKINTAKYGFVEYDGSKFIVANGAVANVEGLVNDPENPSDWYFCSNGQVQTRYTGLALYDGEWFYVTEGKLDTTFSGIVEYGKAYFIVTQGRIASEANGLVLAGENGIWYYCAAGQIQTEYTGLVKYDGQWFYVQAGVLAIGFNGTVQYDGKEFNVANGMVVSVPSVPTLGVRHGWL